MGLQDSCQSQSNHYKPVTSNRIESPVVRSVLPPSNLSLNTPTGKTGKGAGPCTPIFFFAVCPVCPRTGAVVTPVAQKVRHQPLSPHNSREPGASIRSKDYVGACAFIVLWIDYNRFSPLCQQLNGKQARLRVNAILYKARVPCLMQRCLRTSSIRSSRLRHRRSDCP